MKRRLAAILAADVVGYSRLMGEDEAAALTHIKTCEASVIEPLVQRHRGRIVKRMGDGYLVEFTSVVAAVECAIAWQADVHEPLRFRIGIHLGDVMVDGDDLYGDGINVASRLETLADPGGVCLSEDAQRQVRGPLKLQMEDMGTQELKNIAEPLRVFRLAEQDSSAPAGPAENKVTSAGAAIWKLPRVLLVPFRPLGSANEVESLATGVTETIAAALSHFEEFELIDPATAGDMIAAQGVREAGRHLEATYRLEGSLQLAPGRARIGVQLIDARSDRRVWSETLDRNYDDVFSLQDDVTAFVASTLGEAVGEEQARLIADKPTSELNDYEVAVRGIQHLHRVNPEDNAVARGFFEKVHARLPDLYFPTLLLCWTYALELMNGWPSSRDDALDYSLNLMRDVLRRHDRSAHAHRLMGRLLLVKGNHDQGLAHAERSFELNPYHSDMLMSYGMALVWNGRAAEGLGKVQRALAINPYAPTYYKAYLSFAYFLVGRHEDGLEILESVQGTVGPSRYVRIANLVALGRLEDARTEARVVLQENPGFEVNRFLAALPLERAEDRALLGDALRQAGLPE